jgi:hypothetical protein
VNGVVSHVKPAGFRECFSLERSVAAAGAMFARKLGGNSAPELGVLVAIQMAPAILRVRHWLACPRSCAAGGFAAAVGGCCGPRVRRFHS